MSFNGNGVFLINTPGQPVVSGTTITSTAFNALTTDLASGLTNTITKDGQTNVTANIPMSNFKITGLGAATSSNDAVRLAQIQDGIINGRFVNLEYTGTFTGGTGVVNLGSGQFYKDASGFVGIGTASPTQKLDVFSSAAANVALFRAGAGYNSFVSVVGNGNTFLSTSFDFVQDTNNVATVVNRANSALVFGTNNTESMRIISGGNVGIGTISPSQKLEVYVAANNLQIESVVRNDNAGTGVAAIGFNVSSSAASETTSTKAGIGLVRASAFGVGAICFYNNNTASAGNFTTADERMRISEAGLVGIGTATPAYTLDVQATTGTVSVTSPGTNFSKFQVNNTGGSFQLAIDNSAGTNYGSTVAYARCVWNDSATAPTLFYTNFAERMRIDASGNVSIKVTSAIGRFNVQSDDAATAIVAGNVSGTAAYNGALFYNNGFTSLVGQISISGATASYLSVSDYRLKESVAPMTGALAKVAQLKPVTYKWKADGSDGQGFIAHELQAVVPDCVTGDKDAVDDEGKPKYQGVDTSFLVATLTAAIQEQQAIISAMETRLAALEV